MKSSKRNYPEINTGSMADIAFLLLLFFLVATTISTDKGIPRTLPKTCPPGQICDMIVAKNNIFNIEINAKNELFVQEKLIQLEDLKELTKSFIDNNASDTCNYCKGEKLAGLSDSPKEAIVSLKNDNGTSYEFYIAVQDQLTQAYYELRFNYAKTVLGKTENDLDKKDLAILRSVYPFVLSEVD